MSETLKLNAETVDAFVEVRHRLRESKNYWAFLTTNILNIIASILFFIILIFRTDNDYRIKIIFGLLLFLVMGTSFISLYLTDPQNDPQNKTKQRAKITSYSFALVTFGFMIILFLVGMLQKWYARPFRTSVRYTWKITTNIVNVIFNPLFSKIVLVTLGLASLIVFNMLSISFIQGKFNLLGDGNLEQINRGADRSASLRADPEIGRAINDHYNGSQGVMAQIVKFIAAMYAGLLIIFTLFLLVGKNRHSKVLTVGVGLLALVSLIVSSLTLTLPEKVSDIQSEQLSTALVTGVIILSLIYAIIELPKQKRFNNCISEHRPASWGQKIKLTSNHLNEIVALLINCIGIAYICLRIKVVQNRN